MLDLTQLPARFIAQWGEEKVAEVTGVLPTVVRFWIQNSEFPLAAIQKLLEFDPSPWGEVKPLYTNPPEGTKLVILLPTNRSPHPDTIESIIKMYDSRSMGFKRIGFNSLFHVRNMLAAWFLASSYEWSFWSDDDAVHPCGDAKWFKEVTGNPDMPDSYAGLHTINRLLSTGKKFIGEAYVSRKNNPSLQFSGGASIEMVEQMRGGPRNQILKRDWIGFGGALVHRSVFQDIVKTQADEIRVKHDGIRAQLGYEFSFFRPFEDDMGDDISFCARARKAGHEIFVDMAISAGHVGSKAYTYRDLRRK